MRFLKKASTHGAHCLQLLELLELLELTLRAPSGRLCSTTLEETRRCSRRKLSCPTLLACGSQQAERLARRLRPRQQTKPAHQVGSSLFCGDQALALEEQLAQKASRRAEQEQ